MMGGRQKSEVNSSRHAATMAGRPYWSHWLGLPPFVTVAITILVVFLIGLSSLSCSQGRDSGTMETVTLGHRPNETVSLFYIAQERGFFRDNDIDVVLKDYDSGVASANALLAGEVDLATCAEFVVVVNVFKKEDIQTIATIDKFQNAYIVGRKDKGIKGIADLKGKRVGVTRQTSDEFFLGRFLEINGMSIRQVNSVAVTRAQSVDALVNGDIDAVALIQPGVNTAKQKLGEGIVVWPLQSGQRGYFNIIARSAWAENHQEAIARLLSSLIQAEDYTVRHPNEAKAIILRRLQYDKAYIDEVWREHNFNLSLEQPMILAMEDQARWMISNNLTTEKTVPNFLDYVSADGLKSVKSSAVRITGK